MKIYIQVESPVLLDPLVIPEKMERMVKKEKPVLLDLSDLLDPSV
jgi:hypothetical protein